MTTVSFEWGIIELFNPNDGTPITDHRGTKQCVVRETYHGTTQDPKDWGPMPCSIAEAFIRARRTQAYSEVTAEGGVYIFPSKIN